MGKISRKFKKTSVDPFSLSMVFKCPKCSFEKLIPRTEFDYLQKSVKSDDEFNNHVAFKCSKCNSNLEPFQIIADF